MNTKKRFFTLFTILMLSMSMVYPGIKTASATLPLQIQLSNYQLITAPTNSILLPGGTANLVVTLQAVNQTATNVNGLLTSMDNCVGITQNLGTWGNILNGGSQIGSGPAFSFFINSICPIGHVVFLNLALTANNGAYTQNISIAVPIGARYVSNIGNDSTGNGSFTTPYASIQKAVSNLQPGDTVVTEPGTYQGFSIIGGQSFSVAAVGTPQAPITIEADPNFQPGSAIINWSDNDPYNNVHLYGIDVEPGSSYLNIAGFSIINPNQDIVEAGINIIGSNYVNVVNNTITGIGGNGVLSIFTTGQLIQGNTITDTIGDGRGYYYGTGIYVVNGTNTIVQDNNIATSASIDLQMYGDPSQCPGGAISATCTGTISGALIQNNLLNDIPNNENFSFNGLASTIQNNVIYYMGPLEGSAIDFSSSMNNAIMNNTIYLTGPSSTGFFFVGGSANNTVFNNIIYVPPTQGEVVNIDNTSLSGLKMDYNLVTDHYIDKGNNLPLSSWQATTSQDAHSSIVPSSVTTLFSNPTSTPPDLSLVAGSAAIDKGIASFNGKSAPAFDITGIARPHGGGYDIGAYEYCSGTCPNTYELTVIPSNPAYGSVQQVNGVASIGPYNGGTVVTLIATPAPGYQFSSWSSTNTTLNVTNNPVTTLTMNANTTVHAIFIPSPIVYNLEVDGSNGSVNETATTGTVGGPLFGALTVPYPSGTVVTLTATPAAGYQFGSWSSTNPTLSSTTNSTTQVTVNVNTAVTLNFTPKPLTYALNVNALNGTVAQTVNSVPSIGPYDPGTTIFLTPTAAPGYYFNYWTVVSGNSTAYSTVINPLIVRINADTTVTAQFTVIANTITASAGSGGSISPGTSSVNYGDSLTYTITPNPGYSTQVLVDGNPATLAPGNTYTFSSVTAPHTISATFTPPAACALNVIFSNGTVTQTVNGVPSSGPYSRGTVVTLTAIPQSGFFDHWGGPVTSISTNPTTVVMNCTEDETVTAFFTVVGTST